MHYVIIRDDDTNAFTPVECLERLYRPFLDKGLPVNLATIPAVSTNAKMANGQPEGFLLANGSGARGLETPNRSSGSAPEPAAAAAVSALAEPRPGCLRSGADGNNSAVPLGNNEKLVSYLRANPGFRVVQHGCHHDYLEFDSTDREEISRRLDHGAHLLQEAGLPKPQTFVAPYDRLSRASLREVSSRFRVLSTGWYELGRLPYSWWPRYGIKKLRRCPHWQVGRTLLLSHPGCLLSYHHTVSTMLGAIFHYLQTQQLTILVTHWWEYFRDGGPDEPFIDFLHETASYLATHPQVKVTTFEALAQGEVPLN